MTLNQLIAMNGGVGFDIKSVATGKTFKVVAKTENSKFVISRPGKDSIVSGEEDRYEMIVSRSTEIIAKLAELDLKRDKMIQDIDTLEAEEVALRTELRTLGN